MILCSWFLQPQSQDQPVFKLLIGGGFRHTTEVSSGVRGQSCGEKISYTNSDQWSLAVCTLWHLFRLSSLVTWTTATLCCMVLMMSYFATCSQYSMLQHAWSLLLIVVTTSHHYHSNWLPVRQWVAFKVLGLVRQSLAGDAAAYSTDDYWLLLDVGRCSLWLSSSDLRMLVIPWTRNKFRNRNFFGCRSPTVEWPSTQTVVARSVFPSV